MKTRCCRAGRAARASTKTQDGNRQGHTHSLPTYFPSARRLFLLHLCDYKYYNCDVTLESPGSSLAAQGRTRAERRRQSFFVLCKHFGKPCSHLPALMPILCFVISLPEQPKTRINPGLTALGCPLVTLRIFKKARSLCAWTQGNLGSFTARNWRRIPTPLICSTSGGTGFGLFIIFSSYMMQKWGALVNCVSI